MLDEAFCEKITLDWQRRERELREIDRLLLRPSPLSIKSGIVLTYAHWEGHFKYCAEQALGFVAEGIRRKAFKWTDVAPGVRQRILFCSYRRSSLSGQTQETFISYLNALNDHRYAKALEAREEVIMVDDNLNCLRAEANCSNLGMESSWFMLKKIYIDERLLAHRNAFAHGAERLKGGEEFEFNDGTLLQTIDVVREVIRETRNRFENHIRMRGFLAA